MVIDLPTVFSISAAKKKKKVGGDQKEVAKVPPPFPHPFSPLVQPVQERNFFNSISSAVPDPDQNEVLPKDKEEEARLAPQKRLGFKAFDLQTNQQPAPPAGAQRVNVQSGQAVLRQDDQSAAIEAFKHLEAPPSITEDKVQDSIFLSNVFSL